MQDFTSEENIRKTILHLTMTFKPGYFWQEFLIKLEVQELANFVVIHILTKNKIKTLPNILRE